jgi:hypothetical protein
MQGKRQSSMLEIQRFFFFFFFFFDGIVIWSENLSGFHQR